MIHARYLILLGIIAGIFIYRDCSRGDDLDQLERNLLLSHDTVTHFKTRSGQLAAKVEAQEYSIRQLKNLDIPELGELRKDLYDLRVKIKNLRSYTSSSTVNNKTFIAWQDSTVVDTLQLKAYLYSDAWMDFSAEETLDGRLKVTKREIDSLVNVVAVQRKGFLGLGRPVVNSIITNKNPDTKIVHVDAMIQESPGLLGRIFRRK